MRMIPSSEVLDNANYRQTLRRGVGLENKNGNGTIGVSACVCSVVRADLSPFAQPLAFSCAS